MRFAKLCDLYQGKTEVFLVRAFRLAMSVAHGCRGSSRLAVRPPGGERKPVDQSALPKLAEAAVGDVFVATNETPESRMPARNGSGESLPEYLGRGRRSPRWLVDPV
jgi:hypothetical protein